jgi:hypothetical protein
MPTPTMYTFSIVTSNSQKRQAQASVGASMLAMQVNDHAGCLFARSGMTFFASMLAPAGEA